MSKPEDERNELLEWYFVIVASESRIRIYSEEKNDAIAFRDFLHRLHPLFVRMR